MVGATIGWRYQQEESQASKARQGKEGGGEGTREKGGGAHFFRANREVSELEIALLFLLCVASFAAFLFALSPRLYCEGVDEMGDIISSKIKDVHVQICSS